MQNSKREGEGSSQPKRAAQARTPQPKRAPQAAGRKPRPPPFCCLQPPRGVPHKAAQGSTGLTMLQTRGQLVDLQPRSRLGTGDVQSPVLEMEVKEKEAADSLIFLCKWRAGRQP